jgi:hypothetical protein
MIRSYKILFRVEISHSYYTNGVSRDFDIFPTPETVAWMHENNLIFKKDETGFRVFYTDTKNSSPSVPFTPFDAVELRFMLFLKSPETFFNITDLIIDTEAYKSGQLLLLKNNAFAEAMKISLVNGVRPFVFSYAFPQVTNTPATAKGQIEVIDPLGRNVTPSSPDPQMVIPNPEGFFSYPIDLTGFPRGEYTFKTKVDELDLIEKRMYVDNRVLAEKPFGLVTINLPESADDFEPNTVFKAVLSVKEPIWKYYLLMKNLNPGAGYSVIDSMAGSTYTFTEKDLVEINGITTLVFESDQRIPLSEIPLKTIQLRNNTAQVLIDGLSNPTVNVISSSPGNLEVYKIYVNV